MTSVRDEPFVAGALCRRLTILGSTGSIGLSTLDVVAHARERYGSHAFPIEALTAQSSVETLADQVRQFRPRFAAIADATHFDELKTALSGEDVELGAGPEAILEAAARWSDLVMVAIVGAAALEPTLVAARRGATIALANKECVVAAGEVFRNTLAASRATVVPVDSEHNAAFQLLDFGQAHAIHKVTLTASGGPFREWPLERMRQATPEQAVAHPNWSMGAKISVDSATLMNKGLELIEAHVLFALPPEKLGVIVHPQSVVHCLVSYSDGSTLAHLSAPDMRTPIAHALAWPTRIAAPSAKLDLAQVRQLTFEEPDFDRFPCLRLARVCLENGGLTPTVLNAANEIAVGAFLAKKIGFLDIASVIEDTLADRGNGRQAGPENLEAILAADADARATATRLCRRRAA
ncbi:MAG TPA: 1-deoxy-D-xylulose-5-phosphate reductoisomerase [Rhizomicrobium sp.]